MGLNMAFTRPPRAHCLGGGKRLPSGRARVDSAHGPGTSAASPCVICAVERTADWPDSGRVPRRVELSRTEPLALLLVSLTSAFPDTSPRGRRRSPSTRWPPTAQPWFARPRLTVGEPQASGWASPAWTQTRVATRPRSRPCGDGTQGSSWGGPVGGLGAGWEGASPPEGWGRLEGQSPLPDSVTNGLNQSGYLLPGHTVSMQGGGRLPRRGWLLP